MCEWRYLFDLFETNGACHRSPCSKELLPITEKNLFFGRCLLKRRIAQERGFFREMADRKADQRRYLSLLRWICCTGTEAFVGFLSLGRWDDAAKRGWFCLEMIEFELPEAGPVKLVAIDELGRLVSTMIDGHLSQGRYSVALRASDWPTDVYHYRLTSRNFVKTKTLLLIR